MSVSTNGVSPLTQTLRYQPPSMMRHKILFVVCSYFIPERDNALSISVIMVANNERANESSYLERLVVT